MVHQSPPQPGFLLGRPQRLGRQLVPPQACRPAIRPRRAARRTPPVRSRLIRSSGSCPAGSVTKPSERPGPTWGSARNAARIAAFWPAESPSKHIKGAGESRQSSASWASVSAVPERRDDLGDAGLVERDDVHLPLDDDHAAVRRGWPGPAKWRLNRVRPLSNRGVSGELRYLASGLSGRRPRIRPLKPMHRPRASRIGNISRPRKRS